MTKHRQFELVYILAPDTGEQEAADLHAQVEAIVGRFGGQIDGTENWGRRKLAYEIARHREGIYVLEVMTGPGEMIRELDRRLRVFDRVIRHLVVRVDEELRVAERQRARRATTVARRRTARGLPVEPAAAEPAAVGADEERTRPREAEGFNE